MPCAILRSPAPRTTAAAELVPRPPAALFARAMRWETAKLALFEYPLLGGSAQFLQALGAGGFGVNSDHWFRPREPVTHPRPICKHQLESVGAYNIFNLVSEEFRALAPQLFSELLLHLRRQAEVLPFGIEGTNFGK